MNRLLLLSSFVFVPASILAQLGNGEDELIFKNEFGVYCPVFNFLDNSPILHSPIYQNAQKKTLAAWGVKYSRIFKNEWSTGLFFEYFEVVDYTHLAHKHGYLTFPNQDDVVQRTQLNFGLYAKRAIRVSPAFSIDPVGAVLFRMGNETIQASPTTRNRDHAIGVIRELRDPTASIGIALNYNKFSRWHFEVSGELGKVLWRYDKDAVPPFTDVRGSSSNYIALKYGVVYLWARDKSSDDSFKR